MTQSSHQAPPLLGEYVRRAADLRCSVGGRSLRHEVQPQPANGLVTVITVAFNSVATLSRTIDSIAAQTHPGIEYIVVDGGSADGTVEMLRQREAAIDLWLSERDRGISDAFNKGIALASGQFISLVNSDDWMDPDHLARAVACLQQTGADFAFGNLMVHGGGNAPQYVIDGDPQYALRIRHSMPALSHPSLVCRREMYERYGLYDRELKIAMDYEWLLRAHEAGARGRYVPEITSHMGGGGVSDLSGHVGLREVRDISVRHGYSAALAWARYCGRVSRLRTRLLMEQWGLSRRLAQRLRRLIHPAYRPHASREN